MSVRYLTPAAFREGHGSSLTWEPVDIEIYQNLEEVDRVVQMRPLNRIKRRVLVIAYVGYTAALIVVEQVLRTVRGIRWDPLERRLDRAFDRISDIEEACNRAGERDFVDRFGALTDRFTQGLDRLTGRFGKH